MRNLRQIAFLLLLGLTGSCISEHPRNPPDTASFRLPYLEKVGQREGINIWIVDGAYVRMDLDQDFTNYGQHYVCSYIPEDEFWIDKEGQSDELELFIDRLLVEHRLMAHEGMPVAGALEAANAAELAARKKLGDVEKLMDASRLPDARKAHVRLWKRLSSGIAVWIVDGRLVRSGFDVEFTAGGHDHVYEYIPEDEVWIDNDVNGAERGFVLLHELYEQNLMRSGLDYDHAHAEANRIEFYCRNNPGELHMKLAQAGWE